MPEQLELDQVKTFLRMDGSEDDEILALLISSAKVDLKDSGVSVTATTDPRYTILVALHVTLYYENRDPSSKIEKLNFSYKNLLLKLRA